jgi:hypothetical protein
MVQGATKSAVVVMATIAVCVGAYVVSWRTLASEQTLIRYAIATIRPANENGRPPHRLLPTDLCAERTVYLNGSHSQAIGLRALRTFEDELTRQGCTVRPLPADAIGPYGGLMLDMSDKVVLSLSVARKSPWLTVVHSHWSLGRTGEDHEYGFGWAGFKWMRRGKHDHHSRFFMTHGQTI